MVNDDHGVAVSCPQDTLAPGEDMICTGAGVSVDLNDPGVDPVPGLCGSFPNAPTYENMGTASSTSVIGEFVQDTDPSHYCNPKMPAIEFEKLTHNVDADDPNAGDAPLIAPGDTVTWTYIVQTPVIPR